MTQYPLDAAVDQVVHWLMEEMKDGARAWQVHATREYIQDPEADLASFGLSSGDRLGAL